MQQLTDARAHARDMIDAVDDPDRARAKAGTDRLSLLEQGMAMLVAGDELIVDLLALCFMSAREHAGTGCDPADLAHLAALQPHERRPIVGQAFSTRAVTPHRARIQLVTPGLELSLRDPDGTAVRASAVIDSPAGHPQRDLARTFVASHADRRAGKGAAEWRILAGELALLTRAGDHVEELILDLIAARLDGGSRTDPMPAPGMAGSISDLLRLMRLDARTRDATIERSFLSLRLSPLMARTHLLLGGVEAIRLGGIAGPIGELLVEDHAGFVPPREGELGLITTTSRGGREIVLTSGSRRGPYTGRQVGTWLELQTPAPPGPPGDPSWDLPIELARPLGLSLSEQGDSR